MDDDYKSDSDVALAPPLASETVEVEVTLQDAQKQSDESVASDFAQADNEARRDAAYEARREATRIKNRNMNRILEGKKIIAAGAMDLLTGKYSNSQFDVPLPDEIDQGLELHGGICGFICDASKSADLKALISHFPRGSHKFSMRPNRDRRLTDVTVETVSDDEIVDWLESNLDKAAERGDRECTVYLRMDRDAIVSLAHSNFPREDNYGVSILEVGPGVYSLRVYDNELQTTKLPTKAKLEYLFSKAVTEPGKSPAVHLTVRRDQLKSDRIYGYKYMLCHGQPADLSLVKIRVFQYDKPAPGKKA